MNISRRRFIGATIVTAAGIVAPGAFASPNAPLAPVPATPRLADRPALLPQAMAALDRHGSRIAQRDLLAIADYSAHSKEARFHFVDIAGGSIRRSMLVAHGRGSDPGNSGFVQAFSNRPGSNASSEGSFLTGETYRGRHGLSRRLHGLDPQNDLAFQRAIVIHAADYVDRDMARLHGRVGRSQGCFAVEQAEIAEVLEILGPGRLLFSAK